MHTPHTIQVHYYGLIKQSTGEDWENAKISLSTAQPSVGGSAPKLGIQNIQFKQPAYRYFSRTKVMKKGGGLRIPGAALFSRHPTLEDESDVEDESFGLYESCYVNNIVPTRAADAVPPPPPPPKMKEDVAQVVKLSS